MQSDTNCSRCGSSKIIPRARVIDRDHSMETMPLRVGVERKPDAVFFTGEEKVDTFARICGECGFIELFAEDPATLFDAYLASQEQS